MPRNMFRSTRISPHWLQSIKRFAWLLFAVSIVGSTSTVFAPSPRPPRGSQQMPLVNVSYTEFWKSRMEAVFRESIRAERCSETEPRKSRVRRCPRVYMYDSLPGSATDMTEEEVLAVDTVFGPRVGGPDYLRRTNQYSLTAIIWHRLIKEGAECREVDPGKAELFFAPILAKPKKFSEWQTACSSTESQDITRKILQLEYLNSSTAHRHFFAVGKGHYAVKCRGWFSHPEGILKRALRLSYSYLPSSSQLVDGSVYDHGTIEENKLAYPNLFSVPYPSDVHWSRNQKGKKPWANYSTYENGRPILMLFIGRDNHGDTDIRRLLRQMCISYPKEVCTYESYTNSRRSAFLKGSSQFCLEPGGDSPWRKSISDSISLGCIPVTFSKATSDVSPWHWYGWRSLGQVPIPRKAFLQGAFDLEHLLKSIPHGLHKQMTEALSEHGGKWQYSLDDSLDDDAFKVLLNGLAATAQTLQAST